MSRRGSRSSADDLSIKRLKIGFVALVALSGGMIALYGEASPTVIGLSVLGGFVAGGALLWYLTWVSGS